MSNQREESSGESVRFSPEVAAAMLDAMPQEALQGHVLQLTGVRNAILGLVMCQLIACGFRPSKPQLGNESQWFLRDVVERVHRAPESAYCSYNPGGAMINVRISQEHLDRAVGLGLGNDPFSAFIKEVVRNATEFSPHFMVSNVNVCDVVVERMDGHAAKFFVRLMVGTTFVYEASRYSTPQEAATAFRSLAASPAVRAIDVQDALNQ